MIERVADDLKRLSGIEQIADFGIVFSEDSNRITCSVSAGIERFETSFRFRIAVTHARAASFRRTRLASWPYSVSDSRDLDRVIADLSNVEAAVSGKGLTDRRTAVGRLIDRLTGRGYLGGYDFVSPIDDDVVSGVRADLTRRGEELLVTLKETRKSRGISYAYMPHPAISAIREAAEDYRSDAAPST